MYTLHILCPFLSSLGEDSGLDWSTALTLEITQAFNQEGGHYGIPVTSTSCSECWSAYY